MHRDHTTRGLIIKGLVARLYLHGNPLSMATPLPTSSKDVSIGRCPSPENLHASKGGPKEEPPRRAKRAEDASVGTVHHSDHLTLVRDKRISRDAELPGRRGNCCGVDTLKIRMENI